MGTERRKQVLFGALIALLVVAGFVAFRGGTSTSASPQPASNQPGTPAARTTGARADAPDVHLEALSDDRPKPSATVRNLFRFKPKPPPPAPPPPVMVAPPVAAPTGPPPPPPPPPIPYKFIGFVDSPGKKIAVLSDGRSVPLHGREGDIIEGRYRIVRIGAESIEMEYLDGRGRQTLRLSGGS
jgi:hypothetical protein